MKLPVSINRHNSLLDGPQGTPTKEFYGKLAAEDSRVDETIVDGNINHQCYKSGFCRRTLEKVDSFNQQEAQSHRKCFRLLSRRCSTGSPARRIEGTYALFHRNQLGS